MRRCFLVCYDIRDPKRLREIHKIMKGYGESWQYSIFFCVLKEIDRVRLQSDLEQKMNLKKDQIMLLDLGSNEDGARKAATVLGQPLPEQESGTIII